jgi:predicted Zn-dependent protease
MLAQLATALGQLKFSRSAESEADEYSVTYLSSSPYRCDGAAGFFIKMQEQGGGSQPPEFLSTHPAPQNRIQEIKEKAKTVGCKTTAYNPASFKSFQKSL